MLNLFWDSLAILSWLFRATGKEKLLSYFFFFFFFFCFELRLLCFHCALLVYAFIILFDFVSVVDLVLNLD
tara:strand:+ start:143 stop:355 length:213 start_codon:yes stop_codon:yes gene_type:complete